MTARTIAYSVFGLSLVTLLVAHLASQNTAPAKPVNIRSPEPVPGGKVAWVDSYHKGYAWSDGIERGVRAGLSGTNVDLKIIRLDMKRLYDPEAFIASALAAKAELEAWRPDVIIVSDDPAQKYLIVPYFRDKTTPIVFCGVNWSAAEYGYPTTNVTGMIEVDLVRPLIEHLKKYAAGSKVAYFAVDDLTERKLYAEQNKRFFNGNMLCFLAPQNSFACYRETFLKAQEAADMVLICNNAGISDWNDKAAAEFFRTHTTKPTGTINTWLPAYAMVTFSKLPEEQGEWAIHTALQILKGAKPSDIPVTENRKGKLTINLDIAERLNVVFPAEILKNAEVYQAPPP